jgi:GMP synthase-like glutamine amidotransferase
MRVLAIVNQRDAGPGVFADAVADAGGVLEEWMPSSSDGPPGDARRHDAVMVLGGAMNVDQEDAHPWLRAEKELLRELLRAGTPILGVCLGGQLLAEAAGAAPARAREPEIGWHAVEVMEEGADDPLVGDLAPGFTAFQWHSYEFPLPPAAVPLARSPVCLQAYRAGERAWGIQFHAEVSAADADAWIDDYRSDPDAVRIGLDPDALRAETRERIAEWNAAGRAMCERFLAAATRA